MTGTTYEVNAWTPPYRVCDACEETAPVPADRCGNGILGIGKRGEIRRCDRLGHFRRTQRAREAADEQCDSPDASP